MTRIYSRAGFTLAELLVATTLITIVMAAVYTSMTNSLRAWRIAESDMTVYQNARTAMDIVTRELQCVLPGAAHLMEGDDHELTFIAVTPPLDVEEGEGARVLQIQYRVGGSGQRKALIREERTVESPLPLSPPGKDKIDRGRLKLGREESFDLAVGIDDFEIQYYWRPPEAEWPKLPPEEPPQPLEMIVEHEQREKWGLPQGVRLTLRMRDPDRKGETLDFTTFVAFRGPTALYDRSLFGTSENDL